MSTRRPTYDLPMRAFVIAVGSELLGTDRLDTNSLHIAERIEAHGFDLVGKSVVGDSHAEVAEHLENALRTAEVVLLSGGLGPTTDDLTREAVATVLTRGMTEDPAIIEDMRDKFRGFGMEMPDSNRRQAMVIDGAEVLDNRKGTAPGAMLTIPRKSILPS